MNDRQRIYLDHAATSWPKSSNVLDAMDRYAREVGAAAGRGSYRSANEAARIIQSARRGVAKLIGSPSGDTISFHSSGTSALNAAIFGLLRSGDHVVTTAADHNSVLRPLKHMSDSGQLSLTTVPCDLNGFVSHDEVIRACRDNTRMVLMSHASNVTGAVQPTTQIGQSLRDTPILFAVDVAQTLGHLPIDVVADNCDVLASPGHKGLGGPLGTGILYLNESLHAEIKPTILGGTGSQSESLNMPDKYPDKLEAGNMNVPAIAGLDAAVQNVLASDFTAKRNHLTGLSQAMHESIGTIDGITLHSVVGQLPIASLSMQSMPAGDLAAILDAEFGVETRAGLHCAAAIEHYLKCPSDGTLRISGGATTTPNEITAVCDALREIVQHT
ncbi:MAG: aminotransferase class V-fold PLP-dependent enzyme [Pirellulaceae bacterium]